MKKRNLILIALAVTMLMVFTQIGAMAKVVPMGASKCVIVPGGSCPICPIIFAVSCHAGGLECTAPNYWACCDWARNICGSPDNIFDNTNCGQCCQ